MIKGVDLIIKNLHQMSESTSGLYLIVKQLLNLILTPIP
jgi:hypothetical protein